MEFVIRSIQVLIFQEKVNHSYSNLLKFGQMLSKINNFFQNFLKFEPSLAQSWENFEKSTHSYTKFCILLGVIHIPRSWFFHSCWRHITVGSFVLGTPMRQSRALTLPKLCVTCSRIIIQWQKHWVAISGGTPGDIYALCSERSVDYERDNSELYELAVFVWE